MTTPPAPLTSSDTDLRDFGFLPLDVARLRDSELATVPDAEVFRTAVLSWCASWHQVPAASLPDDDPTLARMLGFGRDIAGWKAARAAGGLRGWVKCSDGRLYHPVVAEKAIEAWRAKQSRRAQTEAARLARELKRQEELQALSQRLSQAQALSQSAGASVTGTATDHPTGSVTASKGREGKGQGQGREGTGKGQGEKNTAAADAAGSACATPPPNVDPRMAAAAAAGAYPTFEGRDITGEWIAEFDRLGVTEPEVIGKFLGTHRLPEGGAIRLPSGFSNAWTAEERQARDGMRPKAKPVEALPLERVQAAAKLLDDHPDIASQLDASVSGHRMLNHLRAVAKYGKDDEPTFTRNGVLHVERAVEERELLGPSP